MYPETRVQDIYKSFCQDAFGPGHLIPDRDGAKRYLESELEQYREELSKEGNTPASVILVPTGAEGNFYRVDLSVVLDGTVSEEDYLEAFIESANAVVPPSGEQWKETWEQLKRTLRKHFADIPGAEEDITGIDSLVKEGKFIIHHSEAFGIAYRPHYRIISRDRVRTLLPGIASESIAK